MEAINDRLKKAKTATLPKYAYPMHVITGKEYRLAKYGQTFRLRREEYNVIAELDAQKKAGKQIFGAGLLISDRAAKEREQLEKAADREAAREKEPEAPIIWELSEREREMIRSMEGGGICQGI